MGIKERILNLWHNSKVFVEQSRRRSPPPSLEKEEETDRKIDEKFNNIKEVLSKDDPSTQKKEEINRKINEKFNDIKKALKKINPLTPGQVSQAEDKPSVSGDPKLIDRVPQTSDFFKEFLNKFKDREATNSDALLVEIDQKLEDSHLSRIKGFFHQFIQKIKPEDIEKINRNLDKMNRGAIEKIWPKIQALMNMIRDPKAAWNVKALAIATLIYVISPFDAVPDVIPFAGLADDAALVVAVVSTLASELEKYLVKQAENRAEIEIRKYNKIIRITLIGSIAAAALTIAVKLILNQL